MARLTQTAAVAAVLALALFAGAAEANRNKDKKQKLTPPPGTLTGFGAGYDAQIGLVITPSDLSQMKSKKSWSKSTAQAFGALFLGFGFSFTFDGALFPFTTSGKSDGRRLLAPIVSSSGSAGTTFTNIPELFWEESVVETVSLDTSPKQMLASMKSKLNMEQVMSNSATFKGSNTAQVKVTGNILGGFTATFTGALGSFGVGGGAGFVDSIPTSGDIVFQPDDPCRLFLDIVDSTGNFLCRVSWVGSPAPSYVIGSAAKTWDTFFSREIFTTTFSCSFPSAPASQNPSNCLTGPGP